MTPGFFSRQTLTIPANQVVPVAATGEVFSVLESTGDFSVAFDGGEKSAVRGGITLRVKVFHILTLHNDTAIAITVSFFTGFGEISFALLESKAVSTRLLGTLCQLQPPTYAEFSGTNNGNRRKQVVITNTESAVDLVVRGKDAAPCAIVFPRTAWTMETDSLLSVGNPAAQPPVSFYVAETFYNS